MMEYMKKIKVFMRIKFLLAILFFFVVAMFLFININEIFWKMLKKKNFDISIYDFSGKSSMPLVSQFFYKKSKNQFLISKFSKSEKVAAEFLGWPLQEGDLAWCIWSHNALTENDYELLVRKLNLNNGFEIFRYIRGNSEHKFSILNIVSKLEAEN